MNAEIRSIMKLDVPLIVRLGKRESRLGEVIRLAPGAIIELPKNADEELELLVNNKVIGTGKAVKVAENFGLRISFIGDLRARVAALGASVDAGGAAVGGPTPTDSGVSKAKAGPDSTGVSAPAGQVGGAAAPAGRAA